MSGPDVGSPAPARGGSPTRRAPRRARRRVQRARRGACSTGRSLRSGGRADGGQSLAEFALVLPLLLLLVVGVVEFSNAWRMQQVITNVAREGARLAVLPTGDSARVRAAIDQGLSRSGLDPALASLDLRLCDGACTGRSDTVRIDYEYAFAFVARLMALTCQGADCSDPPGTITLSSATTMRNE